MQAGVAGQMVRSLPRGMRCKWLASLRARALLERGVVSAWSVELPSNRGCACKSRVAPGDMCIGCADTRGGTCRSVCDTPGVKPDVIGDRGTASTSWHRCSPGVLTRLRGVRKDDVWVVAVNPGCCLLVGVIGGGGGVQVIGSLRRTDTAAVPSHGEWCWDATRSLLVGHS